MSRTPRTTHTQFRQGDVLLTLLVAGARIAVNATLRPRDNGRVVLAYGEVTGHAHAIADTATEPAAAIFDDPDATDGSFFMRVASPTGLVHEEHGRIDLAPGDYRVTRQREWTDADEPRQVAD